MIKKIFLSAGILLGLMLPLSAQAAGVTTYMQHVLERADQSLANAGGENSDLKETAWSWIETVNSIIFGIYNPENAIDLQRWDLVHATACLHADFALLLQKTEQVRQALMTAYDNGNIREILRLQHLYGFLGERLEVLRRGALDPLFKDPGYNKYYLFDAPQIKDALEAEDAPDQCPFSTKYMDIGTNMSYGCTSQVMEEILNDLPSDDSFKSLRQEISAEKEQAAALEETVRTLRENETWSDAAIPGQVEGCLTEWPAQMETWSAGGFYRLPGQKYLALIDILQNLEARRAPSEDLAEKSDNSLMDMMRRILLNEVQRFSATQTKNNTMLLSGVLDIEETEDAFEPLKQTIGKLSRLSHDFNAADTSGEESEPTLRKFVNEFAGFLRKSCMNRDCNASLERVLKIVAADACFPYTNGNQDWEDTDVADALKTACEQATDGEVTIPE